MRNPFFLVAGLAALALFFGWQIRQAIDAPPPAWDNGSPVVSTGWQPGTPIPDPPAPPDTVAVVAAVKGRPVFRSDRKPYTEAVAVAATARNFEAELSRLSLIGVLAVGNEPAGIVVSKGGARTDRWEVKAGDDLPGFKVTDVRTDGLTVVAEGREFLLPLYAGAPAAAGVAAVRTEVPKKEPAAAQPSAAPPSAATAPAPWETDG